MDNLRFEVQVWQRSRFEWHAHVRAIHGGDKGEWGRFIRGRMHPGRVVYATTRRRTIRKACANIQQMRRYVDTLETVRCP